MLNVKALVGTFNHVIFSVIVKISLKVRCELYSRTALQTVCVQDGSLCSEPGCVCSYNSSTGRVAVACSCGHLHGQTLR